MDQKKVGAFLSQLRKGALAKGACRENRRNGQDRFSLGDRLLYARY